MAAGRGRKALRRFLIVDRILMRPRRRSLPGRQVSQPASQA